MAENLAGGNQDGGIKDPLSARNTDTGSMKRMAPEGAASNQVRKTIKLKPLAPKKGVVSPSDLTATSMPAAPASPSATSSVPPVSDASGVGEQATVAMDRSALKEEATQKLSKPNIRPASGAPSSAGSSATSLPGSKQTIKLRPSSLGAAPQAAAIEQKPASAQTIKLTPKPAGAPEAPSAPEATVVDMPQSASAMAASARHTIRLVPKKAEVTSSAPVQPRPSDPTVNLQAGAPAAAPSASPTAPHIHLKPSDPTTKLTPTQMMPQSSVSSAPGEQPEGEVKTKIGVKRHSPVEAPQAAHAPAGAQLEGQQAGEDAAEPVIEQTEVAAKDEPSIIFTIAAILSLLLVGFLSFMLFAQFDNHWLGGNISVPGAAKLVGAK